jgi:hypothetical protein
MYNITEMGLPLIVSLFILRYLLDGRMSVVSASLKPNLFIQLLAFATTAWFSAVAGIPAVADVPALASVQTELAVAVFYMVSDEAPRFVGLLDENITNGYIPAALLLPILHLSTA